MVTIKLDSEILHSPPLNDNARLLISPHLRIELNSPDVLTFTLPPGHALFGQIQKRQGTVTVEIDGEEYFRGQIIDERPNINNMREYTCEGMLSYLADSMQRPLAITGNENLTAKAHFKNLIANHNAQVEPAKQFTVGIVDACEKVMQKEDTDYASTLSAAEQQLVSRYGGYLRVRHENGINYIDWLKELTDVCTQSVEFGHNIIDIDGLIDTREVGSVLIPLGARTKGKKLTIASVNNGSDSIESAELIAKYGRIVVTHDFPTIKDANELLDAAFDYLEEMEDTETFDITAVDLHRLGVDVSALRVGLSTPIRAPRHGIDKNKILYSADMDLATIENTIYTFGVPRQTLTEALVETARGGGGVGKKIDELSDTITDAYIDINQLQGDILLRAYQDEMNKRFSEAWIDINGAKADLLLKADQETVDEISRTVTQAMIDIDGAKADILLKADKTYVEDLEKTVNQAQIDIDGANALILLKADTSTVNALGERVSAAEIAIDGANSEIRLKANKTYVDNLFAKSITTENLSASLASLDAIKNGSIQGDLGDFETVKAQGVEVGAASGLSVGGVNYSAHSHEISVSDDGTVTFGAVTGTPGNFNVADTKAYKAGVAAAKQSVTLSSAGWINGVNTVTASNDKVYPVELPAFSTSGGTSFNADHKTTVYFTTASVSSPLESVTVDASSVYTEGYNAGWAAAKAMIRHDQTDKRLFFGPSSTVGEEEQIYRVTVGAYLDGPRNTAKGVVYANATARVYLNGTQILSDTEPNTLTINAGML